MSVTIGDITFDRVEYDADADVLYLHVVEPSRVADFDETPEGTPSASIVTTTSSGLPSFGRSDCWSATASCA